MTNEDQFKLEDAAIVLKKDFKELLKEAFEEGKNSGKDFEEWFNNTYKYVEPFSGEDKGITFK